MAKQDLNEQTAIDMANARKATLVSVENLRDFLSDERDEWKKKQKIVAILERDPVFDKSRRVYATKTEAYERGLSMLNRLSELQSIHGWDEHETFELALSSINQTLPVTLHKVAFQPVFMSQGGSILIKKYGGLVSNLAIIGCYLQTELGHGSNVAQIETTATYIPGTREFELNSPTFTSSKWWVGGLGKTATHGVIQAKLILPSGEDMGPHLFFVQLRSLDDHRVLPGIRIGDIGPKVMGGYAATDNGFARFDHVRIPKENMLSGFAQVTDDGQYLRPPHRKIGYGGMLHIRSMMVSAAGWVIARAATIAIRYATVRRQGEVGPDGMEKQVITYPSVYGRLLPILARSYVLIRLGQILTPAFRKMTELFGNGDVSQLPELHATTSGLKTYVSAAAINDIESARRSMGGHGYSAFSGLGLLYADYLPAVTYEGDNFVLDQQVVRGSLKAYRNLFASTPPPIGSLSPFYSHLRHLVDLSPTFSTSQYEWRTPGISIYLLELRAALIVRNYANDSGNPDTAVNQRIANAVTEAFLAMQVGKVIQGLENGVDGQTVEKLLLLYLLTTVERGLTEMLLFGLIPPMAPRGSGSRDAVTSLRETITLVCLELLPQAIGLTDAFGFSDWELESALGVYNGRVYESLWERALAEPLNRTEVTDAYEKSIRPILQRGRTLLAEGVKSKL